MGVGVGVSLVREVIALALEEPHHVVLPVERTLRGVGQRPVEGHAHGRLEVAVERVQALPAPRVVGLPRIHGNLDEDLGTAARRVANNEGGPRARIGLVTAGGEAQEHVVVAADRV